MAACTTQVLPEPNHRMGAAGTTALSGPGSIALQPNRQLTEHQPQVKLSRQRS